MTKPTKLAWLATFACTLITVSATADELATVEKKICETWNKHKSLTFKITMSSQWDEGEAIIKGSGSGTGEVLRKGPDVLYRTDLTTSMSRRAPDGDIEMTRDIIIIVDAKDQYVLHDIGGEKMAAKTKINPENSPDPKVIFERLRRNAELKLLPEETLDGQRVFVLESTPSQSGRQRFSRVVCYFLQDSGALTRKVYYNLNGEAAETRAYTDFKFDVDIDPKRMEFQAPEGVKVRDRNDKIRGYIPKTP